MKEKQKLQENAYLRPYHWFVDKKSRGGRIYFGYLNICLSFLGEQNKEAIKVLDAGCGDGRYLEELKNIRVKNIFGADYSERAVSFAKILIPEAKISVAGLESLPYENNYFDYVFLIETLEHIPPEEIDSVLRELRRILKDNGQLIVTVPSDYTLAKGKHYQHFSEKSLRERLELFFNNVNIIGQDKTGFHFLKIFDKIIDNNFWIIKHLASWYNEKIWPKFFNATAPENCRRLIARCFKNKER